MKKLVWIIPIFSSLLVIFLVIANKRSNEKPLETVPTPTPIARQADQDQPSAGMANPASVYCEENGGELEIITESDGSQFGMCNLKDYSCEEWAYFRGECDIEGDSELIKQALIKKGLDLTDMKVVIFKHLGKYIEGGVVPVSAPAGGGYVFAVKDNGEVKIVADGNGVIMCSLFEDHPDFSTYLIPECFDETTSSPIKR
ncbi:DUF333 domain-containing protein [Candidatus Woesebacteria bacterium]|nr:DUF333 domain-containing protein [Candidatus Woesebacteria bacterium]